MPTSRNSSKDATSKKRFLLKRHGIPGLLALGVVSATVVEMIKPSQEFGRVIEILVKCFIGLVGTP